MPGERNLLRKSSMLTGTPLRILAYIAVIALMGNLNALMDLVLHPDIDYLDQEHLVVGLIMALMAAILCLMVEGRFRKASGYGFSSEHLQPYTWFLAGMWTIVIFVSLGWDIYREQREVRDVALNEARTVYQKDLVYYRWATEHHGVYVPITEVTRPNPYLSQIPDRSGSTASGKSLTLVNPEYMIRQVYEMETSPDAARGHITSLDPIRAENSADPWETEALQAFEHGVEEVHAITNIDGRPCLRMMRPMVTEAGCLKCHAAQGYRLGDIRGGISVSIPLSLLDAIFRRNVLTFSLAHGALWILGLLGIFLASHRITQSIREQEQAEARLRSIIDNMHEGLIILDENGVVDSLNPAASRMFGREPEEVVGRKVDLLIQTPESTDSGRKGTPAFLSDTRQARHSFKEFTGYRRDGGFFPLELSLSEMEFGHRRFLVAIVRDITEERARKAEALRAGQLAAIGELAAGVAHEINNPINGIINYTQILLDEAETGGDPGHKDILGRIIKEGDRIAVIVRNLLSFARQRDEVVRDIVLRDVIEDSLSLMMHQLRKDGIRPVVDVPQDLPRLQGNPQQLQQVFVNILSNARHALNARYFGYDDAKRLEIRSSVVAREGVVYVRTTVTDRGTGIPKEIMHRIFDPLFTTKPPGQGTGLGLSISKGLVQDHRGEMRIESVFGEYTEVTVDLPAEEPSDNGLPAGAFPPGARSL